VAVGVVGALLAIGALSVVGYVIGIAATAPDIDELKPIDSGQTSTIFAADGSLLGYVASDVVRTPISESRMPKTLRDATVAIEDERFYSHKGVDFEGIVRAAVKNLQSRKTVQGGSTITQQLVRALYIKERDRDFKRKIREAKLASELEDKHAKKWILWQYLNNVPYGTVNGRTAVGVEAAASIFFAKRARSLTLAQSALLAGLPQAPSDYNPFSNPTSALQRRNNVLRAMLKNHYITSTEARDAIAEPLGLRAGKRYFSRREPFFFDYVSDKLIAKYGIGVYRKGGLKVHTTIDPRLQEQARKAINGQLNQPNDPASAIVAVDPRNGYIRAMASSGTYKDRRFNLAAQGHRQPGSSFKTFALVAAVRKGVNPSQVSYESKPLALKLPDGQEWKVATYSNSYSGRTSLASATLASDNTVYAQLALDIGPEYVAETAKLMGVETQLDGFPAETLGGLRLGVSPLEMSVAYATLASGGIRHKPVAIKKVVFPDGKTEHVGEPEGTRVFSDGIAYEVTKILKNNVTGGTATASQVGCPSAGKTGTTDDFNDAWFVGYTPRMSTAVWVGYPNALVEMRSVHGISVAGGTFPAMIWHDFMAVAKGGFCGDFDQPTTPAVFTPFFGKYAKEGAPTDPDNPFGKYKTPDDAYADGKKPKENKKNGDKKGTGGYDPRLYEAPPQKAPTTPQPQGEGNNGGGGTEGGGAAPPPSTG
jgi:penicillin-binding protein 1A